MHSTPCRLIASVKARFARELCKPEKRKAAPLLLAISLSAVSLQTSAEITTDSYTCALGEESRRVSITYLIDVDSVPCEIRQSKNNAPATALWRANHNSAFCPEQFEQYRAKLESLGWGCDSTTAADATPSGPVSRTTTVNTELITPSTPAAKALPAGPQVTLVENTDDITAGTLLPDTPRGKYGKLTADAIREMDDWLIYLSAQTMASIRQIVSDDSAFREYQITEQLNSDNIYERLQNRIEFLHDLLNNPLPARLTGISSADF